MNKLAYSKVMKKFIIRITALTITATFTWGCTQTPVVKSSDRADDRPNFLIIVADDLGFSDIGVFGGEIDTPNLDALALSGIRLTSFYTAPTCSPTRSMLLTGKDSHAIGLGTMEEALPMFPALEGQPGYEGFLDPSTTTIAEKLSVANYRTIMTGKWHLGTTPAQQPNEHGFDKSFILQQGGADHFGEGQNGNPALMSVIYTENGKPSEYPIGIYSSDFYAKKMIEYMVSAENDDRPFFAYLAFTAPHWPLQAPKDIIAKYKGRYDAGPGALRSTRLKKMRTLNLLDSETLSANLTKLDNWNVLSSEQRAISSRNMEIYAAMVDSLDQNVGKVINHLKASGEFENTVIVFLSDNGAEGSETDLLVNMLGAIGNMDSDSIEAVKAANKNINKMGTSESFLGYGNQWGQAAMAPFRELKTLTEEGGIKSPSFISGPGIKGGRIVNSLLSVRDIMPTTLDLAGVSYQIEEPYNKKNANRIIRPRARSWAPILTGETDAVRDENDALGWELFLRRAIRLGDWKAVYSSDSGGGFKADDEGEWSWRLYNLRSDPGESTDVRLENPEIFSRLMEAWEDYAMENGIVSLNGDN